MNKGYQLMISPMEKLSNLRSKLQNRTRLSRRNRLMTLKSSRKLMKRSLSLIPLERSKRKMIAKTGWTLCNKLNRLVGLRWILVPMAPWTGSRITFSFQLRWWGCPSNLLGMEVEDFPLVHHYSRIRIPLDNKMSRMAWIWAVISIWTHFFSLRASRQATNTP